MVESNKPDGGGGGNVAPPASIDGPPADVEAETSHAREERSNAIATAVRNRFNAEGRWYGEIEDERDGMMRDARRGPNKLSKVEARLQVHSILDAKYPRIIPRPEPVEEEPEALEPAPEEPTAAADPPEAGVSGLGDLPADWVLPANASLAAEIQWVQASRLDVVEELPGGATRVHLDRADHPAPSKAAIGWLETSIRAYSKYCDIAARATAQQEDATEHVRRERLAIADIRSLLAEMVEDDTT